VPRHDDLDTIISHALAWERKLGDIQAGSQQVGSPLAAAN
jgi:UDP-glucose 4-epimerase